MKIHSIPILHRSITSLSQPGYQQNGRVQFYLRPHPATRVQTEDGLQISVTGAEHGGEPRDLLLAPATGARLLEVAMITHFFQGAFAIDFLFQSTQRTVHGLAFFQFNFGQLNSHPLWAYTAVTVPASCRQRPPLQRTGTIGSGRRGCQRAKTKDYSCFRSGSETGVERRLVARQNTRHSDGCR